MESDVWPEGGRCDSMFLGFLSDRAVMKWPLRALLNSPVAQEHCPLFRL